MITTTLPPASLTTAGVYGNNGGSVTVGGTSAPGSVSVGTASGTTLVEGNNVTVQAIHGLLSCSEWIGIKLSVLLEEACIDPAAKWVLAEGADASGMSRSFPI